MKKNLLRIIAWNLVVLMLFSFPFCAFAEAPVELQVGENYIEGGEYGQTFDATFTAEQDGLYGFYTGYDGLAVYDGEAMVGEFGIYEYETIWVAATAEKTYTMTATDDESNGINVDIYFYPMLPDGEFEDGHYGFIVDETGWYSFFSLSWIVDRVADKTPIGVSNGGMTRYYLEAGKPYEIEVWSNFTYEYLGTEDPFTELVLDGEENPAGFYKFTPETTTLYYSPIALGIPSWGDMEEYHSTLYAWETYYMYAEEPFTMEALPKPALSVGTSNVYPDGLEGNVQTFTPDADGWYALYVGYMYGEEVTWAISDEGGQLAEGEQYDHRTLWLTAGTEYTFIFNYDTVSENHEFTIEYYEPLAGLPQGNEAGAYAYTPAEDGWYSFGSEVTSVNLAGSENGEGLYSDIHIFELQAETTYLFYSNEPFNVTKIEFATPAIDGTTENPIGYYTLAAQDGTSYYFSDPVEFTEEVGCSESGEEYLYNLNSEAPYFFYADAPFTIRAEEFTGALKVGYNRIPSGDDDLTFTPDESGWYGFYVDYYATSGNLCVDVYDGDALVLDENDFGELEGEKTYNVETNAREVMIRKYVPITAGTVSENGGYYVFTPDESGYYLVDQGDSFYDPVTESYVSSRLSEYELTADQTYLIQLGEGGAITKSTRVYQPLVIDETEKPAGYYSFTPEKSGTYAFSCYINASFWTNYDEELGAYVTDLYMGETYFFYADEAFTMEFIPQAPALNLGVNQLFIDQPGTTEWTFTPDVSGWYVLFNRTETAMIAVYSGDGPIGTAEYFDDLYLQLTAGTTYDITFTVDNVGYDEYIRIVAFAPLSGVQQDVEGGYYAYTPDEDGWYSFSDMASIYDVAEQEEIYSNIYAFELTAGQTYLFFSMGYFDVAKVDFATPKTDGTENAAGYYSITASALAEYSFDAYVYMNGAGPEYDGEFYRYMFNPGETYKFYADNPFSLTVAAYTGALHVGSNRIPDSDADLSFTPEENGWYRFYADASSANLHLYVSDENGDVRDVHGFATLVGQKTYDVETNVGEVYIYHYTPIALGEVAAYGHHSFVPTETGKYLINNTMVYDPEAREYMGSSLDEYTLEQGKTYLLSLGDGESVIKSDRVYQPLVADGTENDAGYYTFTPTNGGRYAFSAPINAEFYCEYDEEYNAFIATFYEGETYKFYAQEAFSVELLPFGALEMGHNVIFGEMNVDNDLTFTPEEDGWYAFNVWGGGDSLKIYNGETLLKECTIDYHSMVVLRLQGGTEYDLVFRYSDRENRSIEIRQAAVLSQMTDNEYADYVFVPQEEGFYRFSEIWTVYDIAADEYCNSSMSAYELEAGKSYYLKGFEGDITLEPSRTVTPLTINDSLKAAGYYSFVAPASGRYAFTSYIEIDVDSYHGNSEYIEETGQYIYTFFKNEPVQFYAEEEFYVSAYSDDAELDVYDNEVFGTPGTVVNRSFTPAEDGWYLFYARKGDSVLAIYNNGQLCGTVTEGNTLCLKMTKGEPYSVTLTLGSDSDYDSIYIQDHPSVNLVSGRDYYGYFAFAPSQGGEYLFEDLWYVYDATAGEYVDYEGDAVTLLQGHTYLVEFYGEFSYLGVGAHTHVEGGLITDTPATCGKAGVGHINCSVCGTRMRNVTIPATGNHTAGALVTDKAATCGKAGVGHKNCSVCGTLMQKNITIPATGKHTAGALVTDKAATCGANGVGHKNCTVCGKVAASNVSIPATGKHTAGHWKTTVKATYEATGMDTKYCTVCNKKMETRTVAKLVKAAAVFKDVKTTDWYHEAVSYAYSNNLFKGVSENDFAPAQEMTRAMLVTVLWRYAGEPAGGNHPFKDVPKGEWYTEAVAWAARTGVVNGISADQFDPNATITREQMATILHRYAKSTGLNVSASANISGFKDGSKVNDWAKEGMQWAVGKGLINGSDVNGTILLDPANGATRGQVATILMRYIENIVKA